MTANTSNSDGYDQQLQCAVNLFLDENAEEAHSALLRYTRDNPDNPDGLFWLAKSFFHNKCDSSEAAKLLKRALIIDSSRGDCKSLLVSALKDEGVDKKELIDLELEIIRENPDWVAPWEQLALLYDDIGEVALADRAIEEVLRLIRKHRASKLYDSYSYYEACITGRHVNDTAESEFLNQVEWLRSHRQEPQ